MSSSPQMLLEALSHTLRRRILRVFGSWDEQVDAAGLARALDAPISEVSYHLARLVESGALEASEPDNARGASRRLYRLTVDGGAEWVGGVLEACRAGDGG